MTERLRVDPALMAVREGTDLALPDAAGHHARVVRVRAGDTLVLFDGCGHERDASVAHIDRNVVKVTLRGSPRDGVGSDSARVIWLQGYPKGDKLDAVIRQATELGVSELWPVYTHRSVPQSREDRGTSRLERWRRVAEEAARQSGRADLPTVHAPSVLFDALDACAHRVSLKLVAWEHATIPLTAAVRAVPQGACAVLVGPEGGLDGAEVTGAATLGFVAVSLGPRIWRTETVAPALLGALSVLRGDLAAG